MAPRQQRNACPTRQGLAPGNRQIRKRGPGQITLNTFRETEDYRRLKLGRQRSIAETGICAAAKGL